MSKFQTFLMFGGHSPSRHIPKVFPVEVIPIHFNGIIVQVVACISKRLYHFMGRTFHRISSVTFPLF